MATQTHTITLSEAFYQQLARQAQAEQRGVDEWIQAALRRHIPLSVEDDLSPELQRELAALADLSDEALWQIARSTMSSDSVAIYDMLLERRQAGSLTDEGQQWLARLRQEAEHLTLRKAQAYALLQQRGYRLPALTELPRQVTPSP